VRFIRFGGESPDQGFEFAAEAEGFGPVRAVSAMAYRHPARLYKRGVAGVEADRFAVVLKRSREIVPVLRGNDKAPKRRTMWRHDNLEKGVNAHMHAVHFHDAD
jgi:hypothetical protein